MITESQMQKVVKWWRDVARLDPARNILLVVNDQEVMTTVVTTARQQEASEGIDNQFCIGGSVIDYLTANKFARDEEPFYDENDFAFVCGSTNEHGSADEQVVTWTRRHAKCVWTFDEHGNVVQVHGDPLSLPS